MKILNIVGARPNFMKIAPLWREMAAREGVSPVLVHTGQHYDPNLSHVFFEELSIPEPDRNLGVGSAPRDVQIAQIMDAFAPVVREERPDLVLVVGDVNSTIACARVAKDHGVAVAHVEAGLRSFDDTMPEELNRRETDAIADLLFVTEPAGMDNLVREGVPGRAFLVGNVMIDTLVGNLERARSTGTTARLGLDAGRFAVATFHRPSNVDTRRALRELIATVSGVAARLPLVLPLHPRTRASLERHGLRERLEAIPGLRLTEPLGYLEFLGLLSDAAVVVTDSGGIQEETTFLGVPCLTMRENTERPITVTAGTNVLVGRDRHQLLEALDATLGAPPRATAPPPLWDGRSAARIVDILEGETRRSTRIADDRV